MSKENITNLYCLLGEDEYSKNEFVNSIAKKNINQTNYSKNIHTFYSGEDLDKFFNEISTQSLFSDSNIYILKESEKIKLNKDYKNIIINILNDISGNTIVIFDTNEYKKPSFLTNQLKDKIKIKKFFKPQSSDLKNFILSKAKQNDIEIAQEDIEYLINITENNKKYIDEIMNLISISGTKKINKDTIDDYLFEIHKNPEFEFIDSLFLKKNDTFKKLGNLLLQGVHEAILLSLIFNYAQKIEKFHIEKQYKPNSQLYLELNIFSKKQKIFEKQCTLFNLDKIRLVLSILYMFDIKIKSKKGAGFFDNNPLYKLVDIIVNNI